ncbi:YdcH family protein [Hyphococcus sp.]|uniref:YdcH family protein n=1 Tax=Hyphococcus sp. TaxID=2038636 RepID=UPI00208ADBDE|nr:MAG: hypothetical protein DHS20C04_26700 [Marinicaulis sp.]
MSKTEPPNGGDDENGKREPPAKLTAVLLSNERASSQGFPAHDRDFNGANDEAMAIKLATLEEEHRDLDAAIFALEVNSPYERLTIARLKKKKLRLKDLIQEIKDSMLPDIIA